MRISKMYVKIMDEDNIQIACIKRLSDGAFIPVDPDNRDYQEVAAWVAKGNVLEAEPPT